MPVRIEPGAEPIPGYKLIERLGGGGFGEVWKAEAPGGLLKAMKFVYGQLGNLDALEGGDDSRAEQELKALSRVKQVRHSYILSVERFDIIDGQLIITTELADRTLWDRFRECRTQGLPGIPREELLGYMTETAEALDLMYEEHQLQHLDIKPQNLFLVYKHVKVADFGLVKDLGDRGAATITGGVTPVYAAPETFDGWLSRFSDQYSLAIVYQELLTGQRPFTGNNMRQLILQHLQGEPDLTALPAADRPATARALAKNPDDRFPTCRDFVLALQSSSVPARTTTRPETTAHPNPAPAEQVVTPDASETEETVAPPGKRSDWLPGVHRETGQNETSIVGERPSLLPPRSQPESPSSNVQEPPAEWDQKTGLIRQIRPDGGGRNRAARKQTGPGYIQPALVLGLGTLGLEALREVRRVLLDEAALAEDFPLIRLLAIDTDADEIQRVSQGDARFSLQPSETLLVRLHRTAHYLKPRESKLSFDTWLNQKTLYRIPRNPNSVGVRPLGRLVFADHFRTIYRRVEVDLAKLVEAMQSKSADLEQMTRSTVPRVYLVTALGGNTGSGMFLDAAYLVRHLLRKLGFAEAEVVGLLLTPSGGESGPPSPRLASTYAALKELTYYATGQAPYLARFDHPDPSQPPQAFREGAAPFQRTYLVSLPSDRGAGVASLQGHLNRLAQFLYRDTASPLGKAADVRRADSGESALSLGRTGFSTFGLYRMYWPRRRLIELVAHGFCQRLVQRWMDKKAPASAAALTLLTQQKWDEKELRPEDLIRRHQDECERLLGQAPTQMFQTITDSILKDLTPRSVGEGSLNVSQVVQALDSLERLLGVPEEVRPQRTGANDPGKIEATLSTASGRLADVGEQKLAEFVVHLIEDPAFRLAGAEEALRQLSEIVERALRAQEQLSRELQERAAGMYARIHSLLEKCSSEPQQTPTSWRISFPRKAAKTAPAQPGPLAEMGELLRAYPKCRYQSLILQYINRMYVSLRGHLSDQIREVGFCRQRLGELSGMFTNALTETRPRDVHAHEKVLLPGGTHRLEEAVRRTLDGLTAEDVAAFDLASQAMIQKDYQALVQICMGPGHVLRTLMPAMLRLAEQFLSKSVKTQDISEMILQDSDNLAEKLATVVDRATPEDEPPQHRNVLCLLGLPASAEGGPLGQCLRESFPSVERVISNRDDELVILREASSIPADKLPQFGSAAQEAYRQMLTLDPGSLHTREDIADWHGSVPVPR